MTAALGFGLFAAGVVVGTFVTVVVEAALRAAAREDRQSERDATSPTDELAGDEWLTQQVDVSRWLAPAPRGPVCLGCRLGECTVHGDAGSNGAGGAR